MTQRIESKKKGDKTYRSMMSKDSKVFNHTPTIGIANTCFEFQRKEPAKYAHVQSIVLKLVRGEFLVVIEGDDRLRLFSIDSGTMVLVYSHGVQFFRVTDEVLEISVVSKRSNINFLSLLPPFKMGWINGSYLSIWSKLSDVESRFTNF